jgi:hypothetical protein
MKNCKKIIVGVVASCMLAAVTASAQLTPVAPGGSAVIGSGLYTGTLGTAIDSLNSTFSFTANGYTDAGSLLTSVYSVTGGDLFVYTVTVTTGDITGITASSFTGNVSVGTSLAVALVSYNSFGGVSFSSPSDNAPATVTYDVLTADTIIVPGTVSYRDNAGGNINSLAATAVPEASTVMAGMLMILPLGVGAFRALRKERMA